MNKKRNYSLKPTCFSFGPLTQKPKEMLLLSADELEAMVLADFKGLYQEECAAQLGVSRPTFAKLIKRARRKMAEMVMYGKGISLIGEKQSFTIVFPTNNRSEIHPWFLTAKQYAFAKIDNGAIVSIAYKDNPIYRELLAKGAEIIDDDSAKGLAAGRMIPPLLKGADILVVRSIGEGIRRNIEGSGVNIEISDVSDIDALVDQLY
jgi:predicted DNA-binding protein (UPF0251 family)/predicted Fe-Mo cluster-binding NifX family protein